MLFWAATPAAVFASKPGAVFAAPSALSSAASNPKKDAKNRIQFDSILGSLVLLKSIRCQLLRPDGFERMLFHEASGFGFPVAATPSPLVFNP